MVKESHPTSDLQTGHNLRGLDGVTNIATTDITPHQVLLPGSARMQTGENLRVTNIATTYIMYYYQAPPDLQTGENLWGLKDGVADITPHQTLQTG